MKSKRSIYTICLILFLCAIGAWNFRSTSLVQRGSNTEVPLSKAPLSNKLSFPTQTNLKPEEDSEYGLWRACFEHPSIEVGWIGTGDDFTDYRLVVKFGLYQNDEHLILGVSFDKAGVTDSNRKSVNDILTSYVRSAHQAAADHLVYVPQSEGARGTYDFQVTAYFDSAGWVQRFHDEIKPIVGEEAADIICSESVVQQNLLNFGVSNTYITVSKQFDDFKFEYTTADGSVFRGGNGGRGSALAFGGQPVNKKILGIITTIRDGNLTE